MAASDQPEVKGAWLKVFCPDARCLSEQEIGELPQDLQAKGEGQEGLWLQVFCPDESCLNQEETAKPVFKLGRQPNQRGLWLSLFCPDDSCQISGDLDLP